MKFGRLFVPAPTSSTFMVVHVKSRTLPCYAVLKLYDFGSVLTGGARARALMALDALQKILLPDKDILFDSQQNLRDKLNHIVFRTL